MTYDLFDVALPETSDAIKITTFSVCIFKVVRDNSLANRDDPDTPRMF